MQSILYLAPCSPGKTFGTGLRVAQVAAALETVGKVDLMVVKAEQWLQEVPPGCRVIDLKRDTERSVWRSLRCAFDARFMGVDGLIARESDRASLVNMIPQYDLVWIHALRTADALRQWRWHGSVLDIDDVPSTYLRTELETCGGAARRSRTWVRWQAAKRREGLLGDRFTTISVCSEADRDYLRLERDVHIIPNGFEKPEYEPSRRVTQPPRIGFIGRIEYHPNAAGVRWFAAQCWSRLKQQVPDARFRIVGMGSERLAANLGPDIDALGYVDDPAEEIATWSAMVVPLQLGAGTRVKIAEAFSRRCPLVSTSLGAYGYDVEDERELLVADSAEGLADACVRTIRHPEEAAAMAERAWSRFIKEWTWEAIRPRVWAAAEDCLRAGRGPR
jgi:glycosyltransferase involved in cell wall biosynthesis